MQSTELVEKLLTHYSVTYRQASKGQPLTQREKLYNLQLQKLHFLSSVPEAQRADYEAFKKFLGELDITKEDDLKLAITNSMIHFEFDDIKDRRKAIEQFSDWYMSALKIDGFWNLSEAIVKMVHDENHKNVLETAKVELRKYTETEIDLKAFDAVAAQNLIFLTFATIKIILERLFAIITQKMPEGVSDFIFKTFFFGNAFLDEETKSRIHRFLQLRPSPELKKKSSSGIFSFLSGKKRKEPSSSLA